MPWGRLRPNRPTESSNNGRRYSFIDPPSLYPPITSGSDHGVRQDPRLPSKVPSPLRNSIDPAHIDGDVGNDMTDMESLEPPPKRRFSMLKNRHASDPQISKTAKDHAPPVPTGAENCLATSQPHTDLLAAPSIITTAPTQTFDDKQKRKSMLSLPRRLKGPERPRQLSAKSSRISLAPGSSTLADPNAESRTPIESSTAENKSNGQDVGKCPGDSAYPPPGDDSSPVVIRQSDSSHSDGSADNGLYATTTTTHTISTTTTFFRLPRRKKKDKGPLFPLPARNTPTSLSPSRSATPRASTSGRPSESPNRSSAVRSVPQTAIRDAPDPEFRSSSLPPALLQDTSAGDGFSKADCTVPSGRASPAGAKPDLARSSTKGSLRVVTDDSLKSVPGLSSSTRTSSSNAGRASLGAVFALSRLRQNSEPQASRSSQSIAPGTPLSAGSKSHSFSMARETVAVPERGEGETAAKYLIRLEETISRHIIASVVSQKNDEFFSNVLRSYMRGFKFFGEPLDMAVRKMLMEVELPKETQQIDRVLQSFANRYHECNPGVYASPDEAYFIAFSILILHTDVFNKNNKNKMQKGDYTKNAQGQGVANEILECFYDNISYTPFIHVEGDMESSLDRTGARKLKKNLFTKPGTDSQGRPSREPVDPYTVILDGQLETLRPPLKDVMLLDDHYNYLGTSANLNLADLTRSFYRSGVLQIVSSRSRPEAFTSPETMANPAEAHPGVVDMKVTKVGILWRKDAKKKKGRSPWQEWGAILTGASLYFFRNTTWIRSLIQQYDTHHRHNLSGKPCVFKPPLDHFKPDVLMPTQDAVALVDTTYKRHKNAVLFVRHGGFEETFLADNEADTNDWLAKLNFASAFSTAGVHVRESTKDVAKRARQHIVQRQDSHNSTESADLVRTSAPLTDDQAAADLAQRVQVARRLLLKQKISDADAKLEEAHKQLEIQLRNARHLQILAPIQNKTREQIVLAAGGMAAKIKWMRLDIWRTRCHREVLAKDLEEDLRYADGPSDTTTSDLASTSSISVAVRSMASSNDPLTPARQLSRPDVVIRPATQPSPERTFSIDDVFAPIQGLSPPKGSASHLPRGSWELPPLSFQPTKNSLASASSGQASQAAQQPLTPQTIVNRAVSEAKSPETPEPITQVILPSPAASMDPAEQDILRESGVLTEQDTVIDQPKQPKTPDNETSREKDAPKSQDPDFSESRSKVRRSLHRTLRESSHSGAMHHHRSRRGKDSASSAVISDESSAQAEREGLTRSTGSFTVHGKKASVINFGSEWQGMSPEERLKSRKQSQVDSVKLSVPTSIEDEQDGHLGDPDGTPMAVSRERPISSISASTNTTTTKSTMFEEAPEEPFQDLEPPVP